MTILIGDARVAAMAISDDGEPLVDLFLSPASAIGELQQVRAGLAARLQEAQDALPVGIRLHVVDGFRSPAAQLAIIDAYAAELRRRHPGIGEIELGRLTSRFVAPMDVAPHIAGAAVDVTLVDADGRELPMGTAIDATPESSRGACYFDAPGLSFDVRLNRALLARVLGRAGLVNYPTEWWHWSYGDRYWAFVTGAHSARYGPVRTSVPA
jgi:D-alanyl-D-alanine dipeptidase